MFFHARNTNMETTQLSHSSSESLKSATMIQLFPQKIVILHKIIGTVSCEGGRGAILRYRSFLHSDPGAMRGIDTIRRDVPAFFGHLLLVWHFVWLSKNTKLINHFLKPGFSDFTFVLSPVSFVFFSSFIASCLEAYLYLMFQFYSFFTRLGLRSKHFLAAIRRWSSRAPIPLWSSHIICYNTKYRCMHHLHYEIVTKI